VERENRDPGCRREHYRISSQRQGEQVFAFVLEQWEPICIGEGPFFYSLDVVQPHLLYLIPREA
jgi:hypothetical protein